MIEILKIFLIVIGLPCLLTIIIELLPIKLLLNIKWNFIMAVNIFTNITVNTILFFYDVICSERIANGEIFISNRYLLIVVLELFVFVAETILYCMYLKASSKKQILKVAVVTLFANVLSVVLGNAFYILWVNIN